ncbi:MAG: ParB/RepB/Spo0J family partition protein [Chloroflexaceae bacterium]|nr:ParB/RepB/Spo0J family partition protein [Chloroflexaceae bacterium]
MPPRRSKGFFDQQVRPEDELARQREVEALLAPRRSVVQDIPVERVRPNPFQARTVFRNLEELAQTIRAQGFTTRLRVRPDPAEEGYFQLVFGERRLRAARLAGLTLVPCEVASHTDDDLIEIGLAENIQRQDLDPLEEARAFELFIEQRGYSIRRLAERIGKDKSYVEDRLALLRMPADLQAMIAERPDALRSAREIAKINSPAAREPLINGVVAGSLSTQEIRGMVRDLTAPLLEDEHGELPARPGERLLPARPRVAAADPVEAMHRTVARDLQTMRSLLGRWADLAAAGEEGRAVAQAALAEVLAEIERLAERLRR